MSWRADPFARALADRHYNRQSPGSPQFVPPGRCLVLTRPGAVWVTSWQDERYASHGWPGAWVNTLFRKECDGRASEFFREAIAATRATWPTPPRAGMITFVDPKAVPGTMSRGERVFGHCYRQAGFRHVGLTGKGLWDWRLDVVDMPLPRPATGHQLAFPA